MHTGPQKMVEGQLGEDRGRGDCVEKIRGAQHSDETFPAGIAEAATGTGTGVTGMGWGGKVQCTDPVGDFGNGRGVGATGQVVVGQVSEYGCYGLTTL